jgi:5-methylthioribose kinase
VLLDAEIAHIGDPAFGVGTLLAHLLRGGIRNHRVEASLLVCGFWEHYLEEHGPSGLCSFRDAARYAGIEIMRRTIGAARVAAVESDEASLAALSLGRSLSLTPPDRPEAVHSFP